MGLAVSPVPFVVAPSTVYVAGPFLDLAAALPADAVSPLRDAYDVHVVAGVAYAHFVCALAAVAMAGVSVPVVTAVTVGCAAAQVEILAAVPCSEHLDALASSLRGSS